MKYSKLAFLGCGSMGGALAKAASKKTSGIILCSRSGKTSAALAKELGVSCGSNAAAVADADLIFLGVKPQMLDGLLEEIAPLLKERTTPFVIVSMAAGVSIASVKKGLCADYPVIRIMPNTPASIGAGMILYTTDGVSDEQENAFLDVMECAGSFDKLPEKLIDAGSAVSGCGPAFVYKFIDAMADGGVACGLPRKKAILYACETLIGAAKLVEESGEHPGALKDAVCSPGGTTIQGVRALDKGGFDSAVFEAVVAAYEKNKEFVK